MLRALQVPQELPEHQERPVSLALPELVVRAQVALALVVLVVRVLVERAVSRQELEVFR